MKRMWIACLLLLPALVPAQSVWRCGPEGRSYADAPCEGGRLVDVGDPRSAERVAEARAEVERERLLARELAAERHAREADGRRSGAAALTVPAAVSLRPPRPRPQQQADRPSKRRPGAGAGTSRQAGRASPRVAG